MLQHVPYALSDGGRARPLHDATEHIESLSKFFRETEMHHTPQHTPPFTPRQGRSPILGLLSNRSFFASVRK